MVQLGAFDFVKDIDDMVKIRGIMNEMAKIKEITGQNVTYHRVKFSHHILAFCFLSFHFHHVHYYNY
jgi:hypothetical protein